eukprot:UN21499
MKKDILVAKKYDLAIKEVAVTLVNDLLKKLTKIGVNMKKNNGKVNLKKLLSRKHLNGLIGMDYREITTHVAGSSFKKKVRALKEFDEPEMASFLDFKGGRKKSYGLSLSQKWQMACQYKSC